MSTALILKLSIVTNTGISIAEFPKDDEELQAQLTSALMAAIMSFSKEVHKSELQSITLHDRNVSFIPIGDFFVVAETHLTLDEAAKGSYLSQIREKAFPILSQVGQDELYEDDSVKLLNELSDQSWIDSILDDFGYNQPFKQTTPFHLELIREADGYSCVYTNLDEEFNYYFLRLANILDSSSIQENQLLGLFIPITPLNKAQFCLIRNSGDYLSLFGISVDLPESSLLFKLTPLLIRYINFVNTNRTSEIDALIAEIQSFRDLSGKAIDIRKDEDISIDMLFNSVKSNLENVVYEIILGNPVIVVGEKVSTRIVSKTLSIFSQHITQDVITWLDEGDSIGYNITGLSNEKYKSIIDKNPGVASTIVVNLSDRKVIGGSSNKYVSNLLKSIKKKSIETAAAELEQDLNKLVVQSMEITELVFATQEDAKTYMGSLKKQIKDKHQLDLILELAKQRNPVLATVIDDISSAVSTAEELFANF
ncbi:MAG: hypothetical protein ACXAD7_27505 [Candidatus Kariarchaeaceae archaeon]|jgi:hypothetical protein